MTDNSSLIPPTARLRLDGQALVENWRALDKASGSARAGAAVKADAYGLGAIDVFKRLQAAGCRDFFVATWREAQQIEALAKAGTAISVLNGVREVDMAYARQSKAKPVINSRLQATCWKDTGLPCDIMLNTGMNRLGFENRDIEKAELASLNIEVVMSHLASADEDSVQNDAQLTEFQAALVKFDDLPTSFANSAGIMLGPDFHGDITRPGLSLYGGVPRSEMRSFINPVAIPEAQILQVRKLSVGDKLGYNARYVAERDHPVAIVGIGYADGYYRGFSNSGKLIHQGTALPVLGLVSMDLVAVDLSKAPHLAEQDWLEISFDLPTAAAQSKMSQYELLTGLGQRLDRYWV